MSEHLFGELGFYLLAGPSPDPAELVAEAAPTG